VEDGEAVTLTTYRRDGGGRPYIGEILAVQADGAFRLVRRVSADRAGAFAGALEADELKRVSEALGALHDVLTIDPTMPHVVMEQIEWAGGSSSFPLEHELPPEWQQAREVLQGLVEGLKEFPLSALELRLNPTASTATLEVIGTEPLLAAFAGARFSLSLFGEDQDYLDSATVTMPADAQSEGPLPSGWQRTIPLNHGLAFSPKRTLQVTIDFTIDGKDAQLLCTAGRGWF
jgi:hypothetical protein